MANPYLSPGVAPHHMLAGLPQEIVKFTCEWDMLVVEAEQFRDRLVDELGKRALPHGAWRTPWLGQSSKPSKADSWGSRAVLESLQRTKTASECVIHRARKRGALPYNDYNEFRATMYFFKF